LKRRLACFRDVRFVEIPGAGHMVHFDRPRELLAAVRDFVG
jgi:pimeloyl-ACP methyl ester carboxylesterase